MNYPALSHEELLRICVASGSSEAWEEFITRFNDLIAATALKTAKRWVPVGQIALEDILQEIYLKLCANDCRTLRSFRPERPDSIFGFLKAVTGNLVHDYFRSRTAAKRYSDDHHESLEGFGLPNRDSLSGSRLDPESIEREVLLREIDEYFSKIEPPEERLRVRTVFWLYYRSGLTASAIASLPGIGLSTKGVESMLLRLTREIRWFVSRTDATSRCDTSLQEDQKGLSLGESF